MATWQAQPEAPKVSIPRRVLRGFRVGLLKAVARRDPSVSIPRRVLRGFRAPGRLWWPGKQPRSSRFNTPVGVEGFSSCARSDAAGLAIGFNTPEGVEGFSRKNGVIQKLPLCFEKFQYPGGC